MTETPRELTVIYDSSCEFCRRCRRWMASQEQLVPVRFVDANDPAVAAWAQGRILVGDELVVMSETGATWFGPDAFIMCLWALAGHRNLAGRLQARGMSHLARASFHALSSSRGAISGVLPTTSDPEYCADGSCRSPQVRPH